MVTKKRLIAFLPAARHGRSRSSKKLTWAKSSTELTIFCGGFVCVLDKQASGTRSASKHLLVGLHCLQDHQETEQGTHCKRRQDIIQEEDSLIWLGWQGVMSPGEERSACGLQLGIRPEKRVLTGSHGHHALQHACVVGCSD